MLLHQTQQQHGTRCRCATHGDGGVLFELTAAIGFQAGQARFVNKTMKRNHGSTRLNVSHCHCT
jgi:hypothetical protein